jgi:hypothetical protein
MRGSSPRKTRAAGYWLLAARINAERRDLLDMIEGAYRRRVDADGRRNCRLTAWHAAAMIRSRTPSAIGWSIAGTNLTLKGPTTRADDASRWKPKS